MCERGVPADEDDGHVFTPEGLSDAQAMGEACVVCHARWPRPRHPLGVLPDGAPVYGCAECAQLALDHHTNTLEQHLLATH
ncbi:hypothetical protein NI17_000395 [Thermobifida halotolerans]|uniref:Uncharacterized protein n=2 Tax=Thermobifida halotolerans TaxID=483545 RepID=A0A399G4S0_9ACTN|nr:hypothetical protein [Thermobifida halotolerans]UOE21770.1 hypothetical protein NI17_000395 [Thermobifida halotolerans]